MNYQKYDELQKYLAEGQYHAGASKSDKYVLRRLAKNFQYDPATADIYYIDKGPVIKYRQGGDGGETKFLHNIFLTTPLFLTLAFSHAILTLHWIC